MSVESEACVLPLAPLLSEGDVALVHRSVHAESRILPEGTTGGADDVWLVLPSEGGTNIRLLQSPEADERAPSPVLAYRSKSSPTEPFPPTSRVDADHAQLRGNTFKVLLEGRRAAAALLSVGGGLSVNVGPESERTWVVLSGRGLVFLQQDTALPVRVGDVAVVPPGEPARVWCRGPEDLHLLALQPQAPPAERRTLLSEVMRLREKERRVSGATF